jgi:hypothetical protein
LPLPFTDIATCHGAPYFVQPNESIPDKFQTGYSYAQNYAKNPDHKNVKKIDFHSCYSAAGGKNSNAQQLSNATGAKVTGYTGIYSANEAACSSSVDFTPQTPNSAMQSALKNTEKGLNGISGHIFKY